MEKIKSEIKLCLVCMEVHEVQTIIVEDSELFKGENVFFNATYEYCNRADEYLETEEMIKLNSLAMKDAYKYTDRSCIIPFTYAKNLTID